MSVTVAIKAYNEEAHIAAAIESALAAAAPIGGSVLLADSLSTDATVAIAGQYPVRILQLARAEDRSCGAGAQLAFEGVETPYFYLMDGDMRLSPGFMGQAMEWLEAHPECAGVGGTVVETELAHPEFKIRSRAMAGETHRRAGFVDRLDGGGLYRTQAIRDVGYFADPALASYEEFELAARLHRQGWKLARLPIEAVRHTGHTAPGLRLLRYRFFSGQLGGAGTVLRRALGKPHFGFVLQRLKQLRAYLAVAIWWLLLAASLIAGPPAAGALLLLGAAAALSIRRRSVALGLYSLLNWNLATVAAIVALLSPQAPPASLSYRELKPWPLDRMSS